MRVVPFLLAIVFLLTIHDSRNSIASVSAIFGVPASSEGKVLAVNLTDEQSEGGRKFSVPASLESKVLAVNLSDKKSEGGRKSIFDECQASLVAPVSQIQKRIIRQTAKGPILQSMVPVDGSYRLIFITQHMSKIYSSWTTAEGAAWTCDGQPAHLHVHQSQNNHGQAATFVITCPRTVQLVTGTRAGGGGVVEYNTSIWRNCSDQNGLLGIPDSSVERVVCTMFRGDHFELAQWIEYHRFIGFQHFLIYLHDARDVENSTTLPNAADITYIPWNFAPLGYSDPVAHQAVQQMDCIQRAQARHVTWLALHDVDEYFQIMDNSTLDDILASHENDENIGGLQLPAWFFGDNLTESSTMRSNETVKLVMESVWRGPTSYRKGIPNAGCEKMIDRKSVV